MITEHIEAVEKDLNGDKLYLLDKLKEISEVTTVTNNCWLCIQKPDDLTIWFLLVQFVMSDIDGSNTKVSIIFEGSGPSGNLREPRHIWWGPDGNGYTFYLPAGAVIKALGRLKEYFDFD